MTNCKTTSGKIKRRITKVLTRQNESEEARPSNTGKIAKVTPSQTSSNRKPVKSCDVSKVPRTKKTKQTDFKLFHLGKAPQKWTNLKGRRIFSS